MHIGLLGLGILGCIMYEVWWAIPFLILGVEISTGFAGSMVQWITTIGDGE
jgi:hypothetical protein